MSQLIVGMILLVVMMQLWQQHIDKIRCAYCGEVNGHRQDCPHDFEQRGE